MRGSSTNTPAELSATLRSFRESGLLPDYPLGSDFTPVEERLVRALAWLKSETSTLAGKMTVIAKALAAPGAQDEAALDRMDLSTPNNAAERLDARLVTLALNKTPA